MKQKLSEFSILKCELIGNKACFKTSYHYLVKITMKIFFLWSEKVAIIKPEETWDICLVQLCVFILFLASLLIRRIVTIQWIELSRYETRMFTLMVLFLKYFYQLRICFQYTYILSLFQFLLCVGKNLLLKKFITKVNLTYLDGSFSVTEFSCATFGNNGM